MTNSKQVRVEKKSVPAKIGRPSKYSDKLANEICDRLSKGESLRRIELSDKMPSRKVIHEWLNKNEHFRDQYARAREHQADAIFDEILEIADTTKRGIKTSVKEWGTEISEADMIEHRRLQVDARKWVLARMAPKKYGDKIEVENTGVAPVIKLTIGGDVN